MTALQSVCRYRYYTQEGPYLYFSMLEELLSVNDLQLCCCSWKPSSIPIGRIVILHGWLDHAMSWKKVAERLCGRGYEVHVYDQRGHGKSAHVALSSHYHFIDYVADLQAFVHKHICNHQIPTTLIGHSMGGSVGLIYASSVYEHQLDRLVLIEGLGPPVESPRNSAARLKRHLQQRSILAEHPTFNTLEEAARRLLKRHPYLSKSEAERLTARILKKTTSGWSWIWDVRHRQSAALSYPESLRSTLIQNIKIPTFILLCNKSPYVKIPEISSRLKQFTGPLQTDYIDSGHSPHLEVPFVLEDWISQVAAHT